MYLLKSQLSLFISWYIQFFLYDKENMKKPWIIGFSATILVLIAITIFVKTPFGQQFLQNLTTTPINTIGEITNPIPTVPQPVRMVFVGDIMFDRGVEASVNRNYNGDFSKLFEKVTIVRDADIAFANLEGPVTDKGNNVGSKYSFQMNPRVLPVIKNTGFDIVSFANNHVGDWNIEGFTDTLKRLNEINLAFTGAGTTKPEAEQVKIIEKNGIKIGFIAFSDVGPNWIAAKETSPGLLIASDPNRTEIIKNAKSQVDFLIVSYHWGTEYKPFNDRQKTLAESSIDAGADLIIGHHPHVIQDYAEYNGKLIFYSLGNFMFDQPFSSETLHGLVVDLTINPDGTYQSVNLILSQQDKTYKIIELREFDRDQDAVLKSTEKKIICPQPKDPNQTNKWLYPVSQDLGLGNYIPSNLIPIPKTISVRGASIQCLTESTVSALEKMTSAAKKAGLSLVVSSAYRSSSIQTTLFNNNEAANPDQEYPSVAKPQHSEHQLGTVVDFRSGSDVAFTLEAFGGSPEYAWMAQHAHEYGFVRSYPDGKQSVTGYASEPWHWRYVGVDYATQAKQSGLTLIEFLKSLQ